VIGKSYGGGGGGGGGGRDDHHCHIEIEDNYILT